MQTSLPATGRLGFEALAEEAVRCQVCSEFAGRPLLHCPEGHVVCAPCLQDSDEEDSEGWRPAPHGGSPRRACPSCSNSQWLRSFVGEALATAQGLRHSCRHRLRGCRATYGYCEASSRESHLCPWTTALEIRRALVQLAPEASFLLAGPAAAHMYFDGRGRLSPSWNGGERTLPPFATLDVFLLPGSMRDTERAQETKQTLHEVSIPALKNQNILCRILEWGGAAEAVLGRYALTAHRAALICRDSGCEWLLSEAFVNFASWSLLSVQPVRWPLGRSTEAVVLESVIGPLSFAVETACELETSAAFWEACRHALPTLPLCGEALALWRRLRARDQALVTVVAPGTVASLLELDVLATFRAVEVGGAVLLAPVESWSDTIHRQLYFARGAEESSMRSS